MNSKDYLIKLHKKSLDRRYITYGEFCYFKETILQEVEKSIDKELEWFHHSVINADARECCKKAFREGEDQSEKAWMEVLNKLKDNLRETKESGGVNGNN